MINDDNIRVSAASYYRDSTKSCDSNKSHLSQARRDAIRPPGLYDDSNNMEHFKADMNRVMWGDRVKHAADEINREKKFAATNAYYDEFNMYKDPNKMLATTLSLIVLIARKKPDIPKEHFLWGELYLRTIKDQWDEYPPNIAQLLGHLEYLRASKLDADIAETLAVAEEGLEETMVDETVHRIPIDGEPLRNVTYPVHLVQQVTALCWHPEKKILTAGWENGEIYAWLMGNREFFLINGPHKSPIVSIVFSEKGGRMVSLDSAGLLTGWKCDSLDKFLTLFNHDLRDSLLSVAFKKHIPNTVNSELAKLARAAVSGDEIALDTFTSWRPRTTARGVLPSSNSDNHSFFIGTQSGVVYYVNQTGTCTEVLKKNNVGIIQILWHPTREAIVILTEDMTVGHYLVESKGGLTELDMVKLSSQVQGKNGYISWAGGTALAIITGDLSIRIWDIDTGHNHVLPMDVLGDTKESYNNNGSLIETFSCLSYCDDIQILCAGTNQGKLYTWKRTNYIGDIPENMWQMNNMAHIKGAIKQCMWGVTSLMKSCILVNCVTNVYILKEHLLKSSHSRNIWAVQKAANEIFLEHISGQTKSVYSDISVIDLSVTENNLAATNGRTVAIYKILFEDNISELNKSLCVKSMNTFAAECMEIFLYDNSVIILGPNDVKILSLGGIILQSILITDTEGQPIGADLTNKFLTIFTLNGYLKIYDISKHEPKLITNSRCAYDLFENFGEIIAAKTNSDGSFVLITIASESLIPDGNIYVWDVERNSIGFYNFSDNADSIKRLPNTFYWDEEDRRLFACEVRNLQTPKVDVKVTNSPQHESNSNLFSECMINVMFVNNSSEIRDLETIQLLHGEQLVNLCAPFVVNLRINQIYRVAMRDFKGLENCDGITRKTVLDFSLFVALGNMDQAFRCIRFLQSNAIWENLAHMCIETGRLDVAKVCLGYLKKARSVRAVTKAMDDPNLEQDAKIAVLAIELGKADIAERLYKKCGRYDLLNKLLQACGKFDEAIQIAEQGDRIHLKNTYYKFAEWLKVNGDIQDAIQCYEKSSTPIHNITQLLMDDPSVLKQYVANTTDVNLLKWWAQYIESTGDMETAYKAYQKANDYFSQVRILCFLNQLSHADSIARKSNDRSACYFLARHYENIGKVQDSVQFYSKAKSYANAVRICKEHDLQEDLWTVANLAQSREKAYAAAYFEDNNDFKRAVELYYRAGRLHEAIEIAFNSKQPETLQVIASEFDEKTDPELVQRCSDFFISIEQPQKAVQLLAGARQFERALNICANFNVPVTEQLSESLTPNKDEYESGVRNKILINLGEILHQQGDYHSATKKFTQAGDKIKAMKSLLKSGDTDKIIFFASMSRQREIYLMAANYLQLSNWQSDPKILKNIVTFYTKAQSFDLLANFYVTCAQVEIDDYRNYRKALKAIHEAKKYVTKLPDPDSKIEKLQKILLSVKSMTELYDSQDAGDFQTVIIGCRNILARDDMMPVQRADVLALLIEGLIQSELYNEALGALRELTMKFPDWSVKNLIDRRYIEKLATECGIDFDALWKIQKSKAEYRNVDDNNEEEYDEEIQEEI